MIIIGGGTAGLTAGCYGQMNGYRTTILEMEDTPAGCVHHGAGKVINLMALSPGLPVLLQAVLCISFGKKSGWLNIARYIMV